MAAGQHALRIRSGLEAVAEWEAECSPLTEPELHAARRRLHQLEERGLRFERQRPLPIKYKTAHIDGAYRLDLVVLDRILLELKAVERVLPIHVAQLLPLAR